MVTIPEYTLINNFEKELHCIADWWLNNTIDKENGGFYGEVNAENIPNYIADKGVILNSRILWFFSKIAVLSDSNRYKEIADIAYQYLLKHFWDNENNGVYWLLDYKGKVKNSRKQIYAQAFTVYALSAYYKLTGSEEALSRAMSLYKTIESHGHDDNMGGYIEAFTGEWGNIDDFRLSDKEPNFPKTMNTHLHVLEAFTALYNVNPTKDIRFSLERVLGYFTKYFIDDKRFHLHLFMDNNWCNHSTFYSFGHDIECSWLLWEAALVLNNENLLASLRPLVTNMAKTCIKEGVGVHGELLDGYDNERDELIEVRLWWVQAEAMVGFLNAYQLTGEDKYYTAFVNVWAFISKYVKDNEKGEWYWSSTLDKEEESNYKAGFWKCPYHNGRTMMEVVERLKSIETKGKC